MEVEVDPESGALSVLASLRLGGVLEYIRRCGSGEASMPSSGFGFARLVHASMLTSCMRSSLYARVYGGRYTNGFGIGLGLGGGGGHGGRVVPAWRAVSEHGSGYCSELMVSPLRPSVVETRVTWWAGGDVIARNQEARGWEERQSSAAHARTRAPYRTRVLSPPPGRFCTGIREEGQISPGAAGKRLNSLVGNAGAWRG